MAESLFLFLSSLQCRGATRKQFFLIFYNDLPFSLGCDIEAYADDSTLSFSGKDVGMVGNSLTSNCSKVSTWMKENRFKLNAEKTHLLTSVRVDALDKPIKVEMAEFKLIENKERNEHFLGVYIQYNLKWQKTLGEVRIKLKKRLAGLLKLRNCVPFPQLRMISQGLFDSVMVYCLPLYGGCGKGDLEALQVLQNKAAQIVTRSPPRSRRIPMFEK